MQEQNYISCVVYFRKIVDIDNVERFSEYLYDGLLKRFKQYEIIVVNDGGTREDLDYFIEKLCTNVKREVVSVINMAGHFGVESAMLAGDDLAIGDFIFEFDNIFVDYPKETMYQTYQECLKGYDIVSARPNTNRHTASKFFYFVYNMGVSTPYNLYSESFRVISRRAYNRVSDLGKIIPYRKAFYASCGLSRTSIIYQINKKTRKCEFDKADTGKRVALGIDSLMIFTKTIQFITLLVSFLFFLLFIVGAIWALHGYWSGGNIISGWTSTILYLSAGFSGVFLILAAILKYLSLVLNVVIKNKNYQIESIYKYSNQDNSK